MSWRIPYVQHGRRHGPKGSDPIPGLNLPRIVYGQVNDTPTAGVGGDGILDPGSGDWSVTGDDDSHWTVTFSPPFATLPTVVLSENESASGQPDFISLTLVDVTGFNITTYGGFSDPPAEENDIGFNFVAIGT